MPLTPPAARGIVDRGLSRFSLSGQSADRIPHARTRPSDLMSRIRCMFTANDLPPVRSRDAATPRGIIALSRPLGTRGVRARGAIPELPSDAVRSGATLNRRSDDSVAHALDVQSMSARRGQRRTRTAEYDGFSVAEESARAGAKLRVNRRSPLSCSTIPETRWPALVTRPGLPPAAAVGHRPHVRFNRVGVASRPHCAATRGTRIPHAGTSIGSPR
jgi:hypothetical protein